METPKAHGQMQRDWDPALYQRFIRARRQPFDDMLQMLNPIQGQRAVDLGCGPGGLTIELHQAVGAAHTLGLDSSEAMLRKAAALATEHVSFVAGDLAHPGRAHPDLTRESLALVFSNAALHHVADHPAVLQRWADLLKPGGQLAFQVPAQHHYPSHRIADQVAAEAPFAQALGGFQRGVPVLEPDEYATHLSAIGLRVDCAEYRIYPCQLPSSAEVVDWMAGAALTHYRMRLSAESWSHFLTRYRQLLLDALPDTKPFEFPYRRILVVAQQPA